MMSETEGLVVSYRGQNYQLRLKNLPHINLQQLGVAVAAATGCAYDTIKLFLHGRTVRPSESPALSLHEAGIVAGMKLRLLASSAADLEAVRAARDLPGLAGFDHELTREMRRRRGSAAARASALPTGPYTFQQYKVLEHEGLHPAPSEALKLLQRLAADPGVAGVMARHRWAVRLLSEMPPEGKVGVSAVCVLGYNVNKGQEISLRLRTDDLKGFRRYDRIRDTLLHELAHMVFSEHDNDFKELNSQLLRECSQLDWTAHAGHTTTGAMFGAAEFASDWVDEADVMGNTARISGRTLAQLGGIGADPSAAAPSAAAAAALRRAQLAASSGAAFQTPRQTGAKLGSSKAKAMEDIEGLGHRDAATEAAEEAMDQLGQLDMAPKGALSSSAAGHATVDAAMDGSQRGKEEPLLQASRHPRASAAPTSEASTDVDGSSDAVNAQTMVSAAGTPDRQPSPPADDPAVDKFSQAQRAAQALVQQAETMQLAQQALQTLETILKNALEHPGDSRYRRVRQQNAAFQQRAGRFAAAVDVLRVAGFVQEESADPVLCLKRTDPGLLWLALSAVHAALTSNVLDSSRRDTSPGSC